MQLYYTKSSPYALCVRMVASESAIDDQDDQLTFVLSHPFDNNPQFLAANPLGKVPCLIVDGKSLLDSEVICEYLDTHFNAEKLFKPLHNNWSLKTFFSLSKGLIDACVARRIENLRQKDNKAMPFWQERHQLAIQRSLTYLDKQVKILPDSFSIAHVSLLSALCYLDFRHADIAWRENASLNNFYQTYSSRQSVKQNPLSE